MDDQGQGDGSNPILIDDDDGGAPAVPLPPQRASSASGSPSSASESPMFMDQDDEEDAPAESASPESASPDRESPLFVDQPAASISPEGDDAESSQLDDDGEEEQAEPERSETAHSPVDEPAQGQEGSDHGDDDDEYGSDQSEDENAYEAVAACGGIACQEQIDKYEQRIRAKDIRNASYRGTIKEKNARIRFLDRKITELAVQVRRLGERPVYGAGRRRPRNVIPRGMGNWQALLRASISDGGSYEKAWRSSQQTLNMPVDHGKTHPGIRFVARDAGDRPNNRARQRNRMRATMPPGMQLPDNVLFCILEHALSFEGYLCHCISRLDYHEGPDTFPTQEELGNKRTGVRGRFFFSKGQRTEVSLTHDTLDPNDVLAPLLVCRRWAFFGIHIFHGKNTFAFSSLGEFGRVMVGWGAARVQRVQHIELAWLGGRVVRFDLPSRQRKDARTQPLEWLAEMCNVKTLVVHIEETNKGVIRRPYESESDKKYMRGKMAGKTQGRMTRALRCCRGMDYVTLIRGATWFRCFDLDKQFQGMPRRSSVIRDKSFTIDVERVVTQEKNPAAADKSRPERLDPLFPVRDTGWNPGDQDFDLVRPIYEEDAGFCRENDLDLDGTSSQGTLESDSYSDDEDESDDDEDDDSSGHSLHPPPGPSRRRRTFTPAPGASDSEEEELSGSGDESHNSVSDDPDQSGSGDSGDDDDDSVEAFRHRRLNQFIRDSSQVSE